jgi:hypothetical protein
LIKIIGKKRRILVLTAYMDIGYYLIILDLVHVKGSLWKTRVS